MADRISTWSPYVKAISTVLNGTQRRSVYIIRTDSTILTFLRNKSSNDELAMQSQLGAFAICAGVFVYAFLRKRKRFSAIKDLPGPENPSWIFGTSLGGQSLPFHFLKWVGNIQCEISKDTSGISWVRNPEEWRRGTSRISGTSFVGMVPLGYVATWIE